MCRQSFSNIWWLSSCAYINCSKLHITSLALVTHDFLLPRLMFTIPKNHLVIYQRKKCYMLFKFESFYKHSSFREVPCHTELNIIMILLSIEKLRERRLEQPIWTRGTLCLQNFQILSGITVYDSCPWEVSGHPVCNLKCTWPLLYLIHIYYVSSFMENWS